MKNTTDIKLSWTKDPLSGEIYEEWVKPQPIHEVLDVLGARKCTVFCDGLETTDFDQTPKESLHLELPVEDVTTLVAGFIISALVGYATYLYMRSKFSDNDIASSEEIESLRGQRNRDRRFDPLPIILGEQRVVPALAAQPYTESSARDQWLNILLAPGHIPIKISDIKIGETSIDQFEDVQYQVYDGWDNTAPITLFPFDIFEGPVDFEFPIELDNETGTGVVQQEIQTTATNADEIEVTFHYPQGLNRRSRSTGKTKEISHSYRVEYREVGATGWIVVANRGYSLADTRAFRRTERWSVPRGQYEVRVTFRPWYPDDNRSQTFVWETIKTIRDEVPINTSLSSLIALRVKATNRNNGNLDRVNCLCTSMVPSDWTRDWSEIRPDVNPPETFKSAYEVGGQSKFPKNIWSTDNVTYSGVPLKESNNPAELFRWVLQGPFLKNVVTDQKLEKENLDYFRGFTSFRQFSCNAEVKSEKTVSELLNAIASTSLGELIVKNGKYAVSVDEEKDAYGGIFTFKNSADLGFSREFLPKIDGFRLEFENKELSYEKDEVLVGLDDVTTPTGNFERVRLWGVTGYDQAYEIGRHKLAERQLRQEGYNFTANAESVDCTKGDVILVQIPTIGLGAASGRITSIDGNTITVDEFCDPVAGDSVQIIDSQNNTAMYSVVSNDGFELELDSDPGLVEGHRFLYGNSQEESRECIVDEIKPNNDLTFEITAYNYAPEIFTIDGEAIPAYTPIANLPEDQIPDIVITDLRVQRTRTQTDSGRSKVEVNILYSYPSQYNTSNFDVELQYRKVGEDGFAVVRQDSEIGEFDLEGFIDQTTYEFRVRGIRDNDRGDFTVLTQQLVSDPLEDPFLPRVNGLSLYETTGNVFTGRDVKIVWRPTSTTRKYELGQEPAGADDGSYDDFFKDYRVTVFDVDTNEEIREEYVKDPEYHYSYENNVQDGGPRRKLRFAVQLRGNNNQLGDRRKITAENEKPPLHTGFSIDPRFTSIVFDWSENSALDFLKTKIWVETDTGFDPDEREPVFNGPGTGAIVDGLSTSTDYYIRYQTFDTFGPGPVSGEFAITTLTLKEGLNLGAWAEVDLGTREQIEDWLSGEPSEFEFIPRIAAGQIVSGVLQATELIESEGLIRSVDDINNASFETVLGPQVVGDTTYLFHAKPAFSDSVTFGFDELGNLIANNAELSGTITAAGLDLEPFAFIRSGKENFSDNSPGFFFGAVGEQPVIHVGNDDKDFFKYSAVGIEFGPKTELRGTDAYANESIYEFGWFDLGRSEYRAFSSGNPSVEQPDVDSTSTSLTSTDLTTSGEAFIRHKNKPLRINRTDTFVNNINFKGSCFLSVGGTLPENEFFESYIGIGEVTTTSNSLSESLGYYLKITQREILGQGRNTFFSAVVPDNTVDSFYEEQISQVTNYNGGDIACEILVEPTGEPNELHFTFIVKYIDTIDITRTRSISFTREVVTGGRRITYIPQAFLLTDGTGNSDNTVDFSLGEWKFLQETAEFGLGQEPMQIQQIVLN